MKTHRPHHSEEEFIAREEAEKKRKLALQHSTAMAAAEREQLKKTHHMHCPKCGMRLQEIALQGVMVERCFSCHGVFLDAEDIEALLGRQGYWSRMLHFFARRDYHDEDSDAG